MRKPFFLCLALVLLASCGVRPEVADTEPDVAITRISGPLLATQQAPESGGSGSAGINYDGSNLLNPGAGPIAIAASSLYDPVTGQTAQNPLSVYVVASDESNIEQVALFQDGTAIGTRTKAEDGIAFKNPFIFPKPGNAQSSVTIQGSSSGMLSTQLRAVATDSSGQVKESAPLELQVDGSRPALDFSVSGDGPPYSSTDLITVTGSASDSETGIRSFDVTLNGVTIEANAANNFSVSQTLSAGAQTLLLTAVNGVMVPNQLTYTFQVEEADSNNPDDGNNDGNNNGNEDNQPPTVSLLAAPLSGDEPLTVSFTASANDLDGDEVTYLYSFGDGETTAGAPAASHTYTETGTYTATVKVDDGKGGEAADSVTITVGDDNGNGDNGDDGDNGNNGAPNVTLEATPTSGDAPLTVNLTAAATDPDGDTLSYTWNLGDGETTTGDSTRSRTYDEDGTYPVTVTVNDGHGGTASDSVTITVGGEGDNGDDGDDNGNDGDDDGDNDNSQDPAVSIDGDDTRSATVGEAQDLEADTSNLGDNATFQWSVTAGDAANVSFGNDKAEDTKVTFAAADTYTLKLTATDSAGQTAADSVTIEVKTSGDDGDNGDDGDDNDNGGVDAVNDSAKTTKGKAVTIRVLTNDKPGVEALIIIAATTPKRGGTVEISRDSRSIIYTPPEGFTGKDTFRYTIRDDDGHSAGASVSVKVD